MNISGLADLLKSGIKDNSTTLLTAMGVTGVATTTYLTVKATWRARGRLESAAPDATTKEIMHEVWDLYIPPVVSGLVTIGCIVGANHIGSKKAAAAASVLAVTERAFGDYKEKVIERVGENKEQTIRDDIAKERVEKNPPPAIIAGSGTVLCCELFTGRYFNCDMETLRKAQNTINARLLSDMYCTMTDFYYEVGLPPTSSSNHVGWNSDKQLELHISAVMSEGSKPCLAFEYNYTKTL